MLIVRELALLGVQSHDGRIGYGMDLRKWRLNYRGLMADIFSGAFQVINAVELTVRAVEHRILQCLQGELQDQLSEKRQMISIVSWLVLADLAQVSLPLVTYWAIQLFQDLDFQFVQRSRLVPAVLGQFGQSAPQGADGVLSQKIIAERIIDGQLVLSGSNRHFRVFCVSLLGERISIAVVEDGVVFPDRSHYTGAKVIYLRLYRSQVFAFQFKHLSRYFFRCTMYLRISSTF